MLRYDIINNLIKRHNYQRYLEIGVEDGHSIQQIQVPVKHGVDPASKNATFQVESDEFFAMIKPEVKYDIIFIDGLHVDEQVERDINNSLDHLNEGGTIVLHDCNPPSDWHQRSFEEAKKNGCRQWNGTTWKAIVKARTNPDIELRTVNTDWGCGIIQRKQKSDPKETLGETPEVNQTYQPLDPTYVPITFDQMTYQHLDNNRQEWLNLISPHEFMLSYIAK